MSVGEAGDARGGGMGRVEKVAPGGQEAEMYLVRTGISCRSYERRWVRRGL